jgi:hypothetical protein
MIGRKALLLDSGFEGWLLGRPTSKGVKVLDGGENCGAANVVHAHDNGVEERRMFLSTSGERYIRRAEGHDNG